MKMKLVWIALIAFAISSCDKEEAETCSDGIQNQGETGIDCGGPCDPCPLPKTAPKTFLNVKFSQEKAFFSTKGDSNATMDSIQAMKVAGDIDITYTYDNGYSAAGFLDAVTRSSGEYYWSSTFRTPWTRTSEKIIWYETTLLDYQDGSFKAAQEDQAKIEEYFSDTTIVKITTHSIWPEGTCVGGRNGTTGFGQNRIFAFKRASDGKKGLVHLVSTPSILNSETVAHILIEK